MADKKTRFQHRMQDFILKTKAMLLASLLKLLDYAEAEDVMQEAYLKVFIALESGKTIEARPYLFAVAKNMAISRLRHKQVVSKNESNISYLFTQQLTRQSTEQLVAIDEQKLDLVEAVNTLPPICRQIFIMRKFKDISHCEIAKLMNISPKTVENHIAKGMKLCRKYLIVKHGSNISDQQVKKK